MKLIIGGRQSGKTTKLIQESARTGAVIVCAHTSYAKQIMSRAYDLRLEIQHPISYHDLLTNNGIMNRSGYAPKQVLIDDATEFIKFVVRAEVKAITIEDGAIDGLEVHDIGITKNEPPMGGGVPISYVERQMNRPERM